MKVMICQPMFGRTPEQIKEERAELVKYYEENGHTVMDTIFTAEYVIKNRPDDCEPHIWMLAKSLEALSQADCLVCMQGWENARGCRIEEQCAREYGKFIKYE